MRIEAPSEKVPSATVATIVIRQSMKHRHESKKPVGQLRIHRSRVDCQSAFGKDIVNKVWVTACQKWLDIPCLMNADSFSWCDSKVFLPFDTSAQSCMGSQVLSTEEMACSHLTCGFGWRPCCRKQSLASGPGLGHGRLLTWPVAGESPSVRKVYRMLVDIYQLMSDSTLISRLESLWRSELL